MKKLILIACVICISLASHAQTGVVPYAGSLLSQYGFNIDTVASNTRLLTSVAVKGAGQTVTVGTSNLTLTGTIAGVSRLYGSLDNVHFTRIRAGLLYGTQTDSLIITPTVLNYHWILLNSPFQYYQVQTTGSSGTFTNKAYLVKH